MIYFLKTDKGNVNFSLWFEFSSFSLQSAIGVVLVSLLLTLIIFHTLF